jgi:sialic acid synthase SpsE
VALGARIIEKHFTDDVTRTGPDHKFSMDPKTWREMVERTRELEAALGGGIKRIEANERDTAILQRRAIRLAHDLKQGAVIRRSDLIPLRPCPEDGIAPYHLDQVTGRTLRRALSAGEHLRWTDLD